MDNETWKNENLQINNYLLSHYLLLKCKELLLIKILKRWVLTCFLKLTKEDDFRRLYDRLFHNLGAQTENDLLP